jgi:hypothetical protein
VGEDCDVFCAGVLVDLWVGGEVEGEDIRFFFCQYVPSMQGGRNTSSGGSMVDIEFADGSK